MPKDASDRPVLSLVVGASGSGKTRLRVQGTLKQEFPERFYDVDAVKTGFGDPNSKKNYDAARKAIDELVAINFEKHESFGFESTFTSTKRLRVIDEAIRRGYDLRGIFLSTADPEVNVMRVGEREKQGGHFVPADAIRNDYREAVQNLARYYPKFNRLCLLENKSRKPDFIASKFGSRLQFHKEPPYPEWVSQIIPDIPPKPTVVPFKPVALTKRQRELK